MLKRNSISLLLGAAFALVAGRAQAAPSSENGVEFFEKDIRPVLVERCYKCHSTQSEKVKGGLLVDSREGLLKGGDSGPAIIAGNLDKSPLIVALRYKDPDLQMPPKHALPPEQVAAFETWVVMGAPEPAASGTVVAAATRPAAAYNYPEAKKFWSFQPVKKVAVPSVNRPEWSTNPVDRFVFAKMQEMGIAPVGLADKRTLLRRVTFDLTGLPPTPAEVDAFENDASPNGFATVVDRLLASPAYGEKWGRHWLDLVRYADTSGCNSDFPIPSAYKYRDYVIAAFNRDKPYDEFLKEQLAGDLLPAKDDAEKAEHITATGYLAIARRFGSRASEYYLTIDDQIDNLGKSMLGLSVSCARCHDHKFDPIPTADYYGLFGILNSTTTPMPGTEIYPHPKDFTVLGKPEVIAAARQQEVELAGLDQHIEDLTRERNIAGSLAKAPAGTSAPQPPPTALRMSASVAAGLARGPGVLAAVGRLELTLPERIIRSLAVIAKDTEGTRARIKQLVAHPIVANRIYAAFDGNAADAKILRKGDPKTPGEEVPRGFLQILGGQRLPTGEKGSGRRELADWIADARNPLTARVMVNRIWQGHFGNGIVQTPSDFGIRGKAPTHPELLDYLAARFVESGWSMKAMHREIVLSRTYQLASDDDAKNASVDVSNDYLWHFNRRRLEAEEVRDAMLAVSGALDVSPAGPHAFPPPTEWTYSQHRPFVATYETYHRTVYLMQQRIRKHPFLEIFDGADTNAITSSRAHESSPIQALFFMNDHLTHELAEKLAARVEQAGGEEGQRIDTAYRLVFGRHADSDERLVGHEYLRDCQEKLQQSGTPAAAQEQAAYASYVRVLIASNEFFFVD